MFHSKTAASNQHKAGVDKIKPVRDITLDMLGWLVKQQMETTDNIYIFMRYLNLGFNQRDYIVH